jgi:thioredoxin reductase (NADPH)
VRRRILFWLVLPVLFFACKTTGDEKVRTHYQAVIIGGGFAGSTAGIYMSRAGILTLMINGGDSALATSPLVENWPGEKSISGFDLITKVVDHAKHAGVTTVSDWVSAVDFSRKPFEISTKSGKRYTSDSIVVATGTRRRKLNCPGEKRYLGKGVSFCATCDGPFFKDKIVVVVGSGRTGLTEANHLARIAKKVIIVHRSSEINVSDPIQKVALSNKNVSVADNSTIKEIRGDGSKVTSIILYNKKTNKSSELEVDGVFVAIGVVPNTEIFKGQLDFDSRGYIKTFDGKHTSKPGVFCAGDASDPVYLQAIVAAGAGAIAAYSCMEYLDKRK